LPRRCEHGAGHEETYLEIIDGLNKEKPMLRHGAYVGFCPNRLGVVVGNAVEVFGAAHDRLISP
jgi:hypothetical protein